MLSCVSYIDESFRTRSQRKQEGIAIEFDNLDPSLLTPYSFSQGGRPHDHFVEFYDNDHSLIDSIRTFVAIGLSEGDAAVVVADEPHREALEEELNRIIDLRTASDEGLYVSLDARETLGLFMEGGEPQPTKFEHVMDDVIGRAAATGKGVRVFGEMVALLWAQGNVNGALVLEDLWNDLSMRHPFRLFCAYPTKGFDDEKLAQLAAVCGRHSHVLVSKAQEV